ncbi:hypothetical protein Ark11_0654 [Candidatus Ichthyocystis hellenicum]|uniref:Uncharacterized protein n=1 Tax=Candidatus Ichthyocystis hellenicum TaxID=1561003 RepID=A0A0S4M3R7_9BURK|nr:hypothetical protein Ark11_0654 [Candidatus Ichthyocystis hellenicum]
MSTRCIRETLYPKKYTKAFDGVSLVFSQMELIYVFSSVNFLHKYNKILCQFYGRVTQVLQVIISSLFLLD